MYTHRHHHHHLCCPRHRTAHPEQPLRSSSKKKMQTKLFSTICLCMRVCVCVVCHQPHPPPPPPLQYFVQSPISSSLGLVLAAVTAGKPDSSPLRLSGCLFSLLIITAMVHPSCHPSTSFLLLLSAAEKSGLGRGQRDRIKKQARVQFDRLMDTKKHRCAAPSVSVEQLGWSLTQREVLACDG